MLTVSIIPTPPAIELTRARLRWVAPPQARERSGAVFYIPTPVIASALSRNEVCHAGTPRKKVYPRVAHSSAQALGGGLRRPRSVFLVMRTSKTLSLEEGRHDG